MELTQIQIDKRREQWRNWYSRNKNTNTYIQRHKSDKKKRSSALAEYKKNYKKGKICIRCEFSDWRALQFHHKDKTTKLFNIGESQNSKCSIKRLQEEIDKCELICANCHQIEHYPQE